MVAQNEGQRVCIGDLHGAQHHEEAAAGPKQPADASTDHHIIEPVQGLGNGDQVIGRVMEDQPVRRFMQALQSQTPAARLSTGRIDEPAGQVHQRHMRRALGQRQRQASRSAGKIKGAALRPEPGVAADQFDQCRRERPIAQIVGRHLSVVSRGIVLRTHQDAGVDHVGDRPQEFRPLTHRIGGGIETAIPGERDLHDLAAATRKQRQQDPIPLGKPVLGVRLDLLGDIRLSVHGEGQGEGR